MSASAQQATIEQHARQLYLTTVAEQFAPLAEEALHKKQSHLSYLEALLEAELEERDRRAVMRRIKEAHFPSVKTLEEFDFRSAPHIPAGLIRKLSEGEYLVRREPIVFLGETGTGKTHLRDAASTYKVDTDAIALKVKQEFAAKEKAKKTAQPATKAARKAA